MEITNSYIINLPYRTDRLEHCQKQIDRHQFPPNVEIFKAIRPTEKGGFGSVGNNGCYQSHLKCLGLAAHNTGHTLIAEDDVVFCDNFTELVKPYLDVLLNNTEWDMFYFYNNDNREYSSRILKNKPPNPAHCYLVSGFNAKKVYETIKSYPAIPIDVRLMFLCKQKKNHLEVWSAGEQLVKQNSALGTDLRKKSPKSGGLWA